MAKNQVGRNDIWKWLTLILVVGLSGALLFPSKDASGELKSKIRRGLDLKGGSAFTLGVDEVRLRDKLVERDPYLANDPAALDAKVVQTLEGSDDRIVEIIRKRVDAMGTNEPLIQPIKDKHRILVQLPGADKATRDAARERLGKMAYLEFRLVPKNESDLISQLPDDRAPVGFVNAGGKTYRRDPNWYEISQGSNYLSRLSSFGRVRSAEPVRFILERDERDPSLYRPRFVSRKVNLTGADLAHAEPGIAEGLERGCKVLFSLSGEGSEKFRRLTKANIGRQLAIILDDELVSAPVIQDEISGSGRITGNFTFEEAKALASDLNAGALPAPLTILAESTVDPTVGRDAIRWGSWASLIGFALVACFMLFYYRYAGAVADVALVLDFLLLPAALFLVASLLGFFVHDPSMDGGRFQLPVLTMPGIAGLVLTLGMAVDANVLIFERIREEFLRGGTVGKAVENGYARAFTAILDSNITTIITGAILYSVGTGPVRGFAIMLTGGVIISMFTALVVTRLVIDHTTDPNSSKPFKMVQFFQSPNVDWMRYGRKTLLLSALIIVATIGLFAYRAATKPSDVLAVDLTGGTSIVYGIEGRAPEVKDVRSALDDIDNAMVIQYQGDNLMIKTGIASSSGTTLYFNLTRNADKFNNIEASREIAKFDVSSSVRVLATSTSVGADGLTNTVGRIVVKVSETSATTKGQRLAEAGSSVAQEVARILQRHNDRFGVVLDDKGVDETIGVEKTIETALNEAFTDSKFTAESHEVVGSMVGQDLRESGTKAVLFSLVAILIYVAFRFRFGFGLGGIVALAHDALISLGLYTLLGHQVSLIVITALLTIIGYSINDTVVIFDRIRELLNHDKRMSFYDLCNAAINSCLSRTVITSVTTFFAVAALFVFGEGSIFDFALTMLIGVVAGTYSSIFIATPIMFWWYKGKRPDLEEDEEKEGGR